ncbi:serine hydrolase [Enterococcus silesiacus]|uniref:Serine hydrolase n=1 Tax=Enterococcus silesiacus TaxID=332949 RepID=A0A0S3K823_9ENTE|nr:serine hydrolase domain-containing protein [Enterococcus silesiacus]ALS00447.1 serine hydrolase [Enterococcus silesiacus]OJG90182.1 hypothetical protein RV15_GL001446 [Enterococcus silesiacus]
MNKRWKWLVWIGAVCILSLLFSNWFFNKGNELVIEPVSGKKQNQQISTESGVKDTIDQQIKDSHFQGDALLIHADQIFYHHSYGYADEKNKRLNKVNGIFPIASLQKMITSAIIFELIKEKKLTSDTTLDIFYPDIKFSKTITIQELLNHSSGILMAEEEPDQLLTNQESQLDNVLKTVAVVANKDFNYTNSNYTLLAGIISKLTGQPYEEVIKERVINKLALTNTYFWDDLPKGETIPKPYFYIGEDYQADPFPASEKLFSSLLGAGNMYMSTEDFWLFIKSLADGKLFEQAEYEQLADVKKGGYQAGMVYFDELKYSEGTLGGYDTVIYGGQDNQNLVILFANQPTNDGMQALSERLYDQLLKI